MARRLERDTSGTMAKGRIIIVEDEMLSGLDYAQTLSDAGYEVVGITDRASDAVRAARLHRPDLLIMDISLHTRFDGIRAAREISRDIGAAIVFVSGRCESATRQRAAQVRPVAHLEKPIRNRDLLRAVGKATPPRWPLATKAGLKPPPRRAA